MNLSALRGHDATSRKLNKKTIKRNGQSTKMDNSKNMNNNQDDPDKKNVKIAPCVE